MCFSSAAAAPRVDLIFFDAGGGHRASAAALKSALEQRQRKLQVRMLNLREALGPTDIVQRITGVEIEEVYNSMLRNGITIGSGLALRFTQLLIRLTHSRAICCIEKYWQQSPPDLAVSMVPNFNRAIFEGLRAACLDAGISPVPMVTVMTDLADYPSHFWIEPQEQYLICATRTAERQALAAGHAPDRVFRTSGMIVRQEFYNKGEIDREAERRRLGLDPVLPTGVVMLGGFGSPQMIRIAEQVAAKSLRTQLIFLCGHNSDVRARLTGMRLPYPCHVEGFTSEVPFFMQLADFFIGKPGPGSISEALVMGLPVIVERNSRTLVQERFNTDWIARHRLGLVVRSFRQVAGAIAHLLEANHLAEFRAKAASIKNRAVFEVPEILERLLGLLSTR
jgi:UDP-N-acetylglucosamine:LPS N-acetylglucosamine transferase